MSEPLPAEACSECLEQARLLAMGSEREAALLAKIDQLTRRAEIAELAARTNAETVAEIQKERDHWERSYRRLSASSWPNRSAS